MKKKNKPTKKQIRHEQKKRRHKKDQRRQYQTLQQLEGQLWRELQPLTEGYNLDDQDEFEGFAAHAMVDASFLYDEPEFQDWEFEPADAAAWLSASFSIYVPPPDELSKLPREEQADLVSEACIRTIVHFISPELQNDTLNALGRCRRRFKREQQREKLALTAAIEWLLRSDRRREIWATCGVFHRMLMNAIDVAKELEEEKDKALSLAQALDPTVETTDDLQEGTPAYKAFWKAIKANPQLSCYVERQSKVESLATALESALDAELALELLGEEEVEQFLKVVSAKLKEVEILSDTAEWQVPASHIQAFLTEHLPHLIKMRYTPEWFEEMMEDLKEIAADTKRERPLARRAAWLHQALTASDIPYWENPSLVHFLFVAALKLLVRDATDEDGA